METINEVIKNSAVGTLSKSYQYFIIFLSLAIVGTSLAMLFYIFTNIHVIRTSFGY